MTLTTLICALVLALAFIFGDRLERFAESLGHRRWMSFAAGVSTAYVFVEVIPELSLHNQAAVEIAGNHPLFGAQRIYGQALVAFVVLYGLDHFVPKRKHRTGGEQGVAFDGADLLQIAGFAVYSWLIGYFLMERAEKGVLVLGLYTAAMGLHFMIVDHMLRESRGEVYGRHGYWILAVSVPLGWLSGGYMPVSKLTFARLFAWVAGGMLITSAQAELPTEREGRFWPFCVGAAGYAMLILAV